MSTETMAARPRIVTSGPTSDMASWAMPLCDPPIPKLTLTPAQSADMARILAEIEHRISTEEGKLRQHAHLFGRPDATLAERLDLVLLGRTATELARENPGEDSRARQAALILRMRARLKEQAARQALQRQNIEQMRDRLCRQADRIRQLKERAADLEQRRKQSRIQRLSQRLLQRLRPMALQKNRARNACDG